VGHDISLAGNQPAASKTPLLKTWKDPDDVHGISRSLIGFAQFYSKYIPHFECRIEHCHNLMNLFDYSHKLTDEQFSDEVKAEIEDMKSSILSQPILQHAEPNKPTFGQTFPPKACTGSLIALERAQTLATERLLRQVDEGQREGLSL